MKKKKPINIDIGWRVKQEREAAGLTQEALAEMLDLGVKHISAIECGAVGLSLASLQKICKVLSISSDTLLFGNSNKNNVQALAARLELLPPEKYEIANDILCKLFEAFAISEKKK